jgi:hypothetical protein
MEHFYTHLQEGMTKAESLRQAQMDVRLHQDEDGNYPYTNPYYWAGYVLSGSGGFETMPQDGGFCISPGIIVFAMGMVVWWRRNKFISGY